MLVEDLATGERINLSDTEDEAFWSWAIVETLRHTGVRIEELTELTHLALVSYRLPDTGEIVPMLQIVPSKANVERLLSRWTRTGQRPSGHHHPPPPAERRNHCPHTALRSARAHHRARRTFSNDDAVRGDGRSSVPTSSAESSTRPSSAATYVTPPVKRCVSPPMTSAGCSPRKQSTTGSRSTSLPGYSGTPT